MPAPLRSLVVASTAVLLLAPAALPAATAATGSGTPGGTTAAPLRIGTYNVEVHRSTAEFREGVEALAPRADLMGLQEVDTDAKEAVMGQMASSGWAYYRVKPGLQTPVMWRTARFSFVSGRIVRTSRAANIGKVPTMKAHQKRRTATVVHLLDKVTGDPISVICVHLVSGATRDGRAWPGRRRLYALYVRGLKRLATITAHEQHYGQVFVLGDFNAGWLADNQYRRPHMPVRTFKRLGMRSMWATEVPANGRGTHFDPKNHHSGLIDQVYSEMKATSATVEADIKHSDHRPAVATYATD